MYINRIINKEISRKINETDKIIVIYGARQCGKTTLANTILSKFDGRVLKINADQIKYNDILASRDLKKIKGLVNGYDLVFIDEAQRINDLGINIKIMHDEIPKLKILLTGSSSFDIAGKISEPLTGRKYVTKLFPLAVQELKSIYNDFEINEVLEDLLVFGGYPEVFTTINIKDKADLLYEIGSSYLFKDITEQNTLKHQDKLRDLLRLLAFQIGSEVSINELSKNLKISRDTVENYINLLENSFVIFRLSAFSKNLRKEISKMDKFYFFDNGIRNMIIENLNPLNIRNDIGQLWENFIISERHKVLSNNNIRCNPYFWRTYTGAKLDYIEECTSKLNAFEIKFTKSKFKMPATFSKTYPNSEMQLINRANFMDYMKS